MEPPMEPPDGLYVQLVYPYMGPFISSGIVIDIDIVTALLGCLCTEMEMI